MELERRWPERAAQVRGLAWIADGVATSEEIAASALVKCGRVGPETFDALVANPQTRESVNDKTGSALGRLCDLEAEAPDLWKDFMRKRWVQDGLTEEEGDLIQGLFSMIFESAAHEESHRIWAAVINMPFLDTFDRFDRMTVSALAQLDDEIGYGEVFVATMSRPRLRDGITDEEARIVSMSHMRQSYRPESLLRLLVDDGVYSEERLTELPLSGAMHLAIFRFRDLRSPSMDYLERSVHAIEKFMGEPFPTDFVGLVVDGALPPGSGGAYFDTHIGFLPQFEDEWQYALLGVIAHETAHYYWHGNVSWIDEGGASLLGALMESGWDANALEIRACEEAATIAELEAVDPEFGDPAFGCNYHLGRAIFLDLYRALGEETFRQGFQDLYAKSRHDDPDDRCQGTRLDICHVGEAFESVAPGDVGTRVDEIIARWYGPVP